MKKLENITNAPPPDVDYPNSRIKDESNPGVGNGVPVNEAVWGDSMQFLQKLLIDAGIVANDLFDNVTNGYQTITALEAKINVILDPFKPSAAITHINPSANIEEVQYRNNVSTIEVKMKPVLSGGSGTALFSLNSGYRPLVNTLLPIGTDGEILVQTSGAVILLTTPTGFITGLGYWYSFSFAKW